MKESSYAQREAASSFTPITSSQLETRAFDSPTTDSSEYQESEAWANTDLTQIPILPTQTAAPVQAKLTVGAVNDPYEQEADAVADRVVNQINSPPEAQSTVQREGEEDELQMKPIDGAIQREGEEDELQMKPIDGAIQREGEEDELQMKPIDGAIQREGEEDELQMKPIDGAIQREAEEDELQMKPMIQRQEEATAAPNEVEGAIEQSRGSGQSLDEGLQGSMGQAMGADFSGVRVHTGDQANQLNQSLQAKAFTTGQDIYFRSGEYNPGSRGGQELLAHELTHVVQQNGAAVQRDPIEKP
jgi:hypothetical protein